MLGLGLGLGGHGDLRGIFNVVTVTEKSLIIPYTSARYR